MREAGMTDSTPGNDRALWEGRFRLLLGAGFLVRLGLALTLDLTPDEAYYWEFSRRLDWSFYDHPPMVGCLIALGRLLFGHSELAIRFPALVGILGLSWLLFAIGRDLLGNPRAGFFAAAVLHLTPAGIALGFVTTPDVPLALFWGLATWAFLRILERDRVVDWFWLGAALGLGASSKYNMIFFCPGVAVTLLAFPRLRPLVGSGRFWLMFGLAFLGAVPVLWWNHQHDWASIRFQLHHGFKPAQRGLWGCLGEFLGGQAGTIGPTLFPVLWLVVLDGLRRGWRQADEKRFFLAAAAFPTMAFFAYRGLQSKVEANWPQVAYLSAMLLFGEWLGAGDGPRRLRWVLGPSAVLAALAVIQALTLILPIPPRSDVSTRLHGWQEMGRAVRALDDATGRREVFVGQGAPLTALVAFYGGLPPERIMETHGTGNWKFWGERLALPAGSGIVYVDEGRLSEAEFYLPRFLGPNASESHPIRARGRELRTINLTVLKNSRDPVIFK